MVDSTPACPFCGSPNTDSTPRAGPRTVYHCRDCDRAIAHGDL